MDKPWHKYPQCWILLSVSLMIGVSAGYLISILLKADLSNTLMVISSVSAAVAAMLMVWVGLSANAVSKRMLEVAQLAKDVPLLVESTRERFELWRTTMRFVGEITSVSRLLTPVDDLTNVAAEWVSLFTAIAPEAPLPFKKGEAKARWDEFVSQARVLYGRAMIGDRIEPSEISNLRAAAMESTRLLERIVAPFVRQASVSSTLQKDFGLTEK